MPEAISVKNWVDWLEKLDLLEEDRQEIIKFVFLWMKYNGWYNNTFKKLRDRQGAIKLSDFLDAGICYEQFRQPFVNGFSKIQVKNYTNDGQAADEIRRGIYKPNGHTIEEPFSEGADCLCHFLKAVYKIRCNFFHGQKEKPDEINVKLIRWAYKSLSELFNALPDSETYRGLK